MWALLQNLGYVILLNHQANNLVSDEMSKAVNRIDRIIFGSCRYFFDDSMILQKLGSCGVDFFDSDSNSDSEKFLFCDSDSDSDPENFLFFDSDSNSDSENFHLLTPIPTPKNSDIFLSKRNYLKYTLRLEFKNI
jgi:hypothetical protein